MIALLLDPFFWFALAVAGFAGWALLRWAASGGRLPLRGRRGSASAFSAAALAGQVFYQAGARQAQETQLREALRRDDDDEGDRPQPGQAPTNGAVTDDAAANSGATDRDR